MTSKKRIQKNKNTTCIKIFIEVLYMSKKTINYFNAKQQGSDLVNLDSSVRWDTTELFKMSIINTANQYGKIFII